MCRIFALQLFFFKKRIIFELMAITLNVSCLTGCLNNMLLNNNEVNYV